MRGRRALVAFGATTAALMAPLGMSTTTSGAMVPASPIHANGSIDEAWITGASSGDHLTLLRDGSAVKNAANPGAADALGSLIIRNLSPGGGYSWRDSSNGEHSQTFSVLAPGANPPANAFLYSGQSLHAGLNYVTVRDGISLAATVRFPFGKTCSESAPCPTVIEYSGYNVAGPTDPIPSVIDGALGAACSNCGDPNLLPDSATDVGAVVARMSGFATVSLQMRGTGCSGGAFDLLGYPSDYDAYDAIEVTAHQPWVAHHKVGMVGISYSGLSQLPSAGTDPPGLAAITPMSPTDDLFSTGYPGGIYNNGFAAEWVGQRIDDAKPAAVLKDGSLSPLATVPVDNVAQPWTYYQIGAELAASHGASSTCLANQALHGQSQDLAGLVGPQMVRNGEGRGRDPALFNRRSMVEWAHRVRVPVFLSGALQDEQTGPQWPALIDAFPENTPVFANMINGDHIDSLDPQTISRWLEFLDLYVADEVPKPPNAIDALVLDKFTASAASVSAESSLPALRFTGAPDLAVARGEFARQTPKVRALFDNGAGATGPGTIGATYTANFSSWPPAGTVTALHLGSGGLLERNVPSTAQSEVTLDPDVRPRTSLPASNNVWAADPGWEWSPVPAADGLGFQTAPFATATTIAGPATLGLWVKAGAPVEDFQVTVTEVRPQVDQEEYVTSGFLRSTDQTDLPESTALMTAPSYLPGQARHLSASHFELIKIPIDPVVHTFRPGTALRIVISAPGGDRPIWTFDTLDHGQKAWVGLGGSTTSTLTVNVVRNVSATSALPSCGALRGEPCRPYVAEGNQTASS